MNKQFVSVVVVALTISFNFACAPAGGGSSSTPDAVTRGAGGNPIAEGTVSGGGGNGCGGVVFEGRAKKITDFPEYQLYVAPLLRRLSEQGRDSLVTYLRWVAEDKAWYFVPCALKPLSTDQLGIAVDSDQMARHIEHGIYIDAREQNQISARDHVEKTYATQNMKERSQTLLHEMVMGAYLLMKKTSKEQCQALAKRDAHLCADAEVMAIVSKRKVDPVKALIIDGADRDRITAMTTFLSSKDADFSTANVKRMRERLGFEFPWDQATSDLDLPGLMKAVARSRQLGDHYKVVGGKKYLEENNSVCSIDESVWYGALGLQVSFPFSFDSKDYDKIKAFQQKYSLSQIDSICEEDVGVFYNRSQIIGNVWSERPCKGGNVLKWPFMTERFSTSVNAGNFDVRGVLRDGQIFDEVSVATVANGYSAVTGGREIGAHVVRILATRETNPRIQSIRFEPKQVLKVSSVGEADPSDLVELLDIPDLPPIECVRQAAK